MHLGALYCVFVIFDTNANVILDSKTTASTSKTSTKSWLYKDYMKKFEITKIWEDLKEKSKKTGKKVNLKSEFDYIVNKMDETDELLSVKIDKGDPKILVNKDTRRQKVNPELSIGGWGGGPYPGFAEYSVFRPHKEFNYIQPKGLGAKNVRDPFYTRYRINELMKQLIYDTRVRLVGWQHKRDIYRNDQLYKMGYLTSKLDEAVKGYLRFAYRAYKGCLLYIHNRPYFDGPPTILETHERMLFKWFSIDLYIDLMVENDDNARGIIANYSTGRRKRWKFID